VTYGAVAYEYANLLLCTEACICKVSNYKAINALKAAGKPDKGLSPNGDYTSGYDCVVNHIG